MKKFLSTFFTIVITALVVGSGMYWGLVLKNSQPKTEPEIKVEQENEADLYNKPDQENSANVNQVVKYNCEQSGGSFKNNNCVCPIEENLGQTQEIMYDKNTGYCQTTIGGPGGEVLKEEIKLQELKIIQNTIVSYNCKQSGGTYKNNTCSCPSEYGEKLEYDLDTGYCVSSFGTPGGELGATARKLQEFQLLKKQ